MKEVIKRQIEILEEIQNDYKKLDSYKKIDICINLSVQINELVKTYLDIEKTTITKER